MPTIHLNNHRLAKIFEKNVSFKSFMFHYLSPLLRNNNETTTNPGVTGVEYYARKNKLAVLELEKLENMSNRQRLSYGRRIKNRWLSVASRDIRNSKKEIKKLTDLLAKLIAWRADPLLADTKKELVKDTIDGIENGMKFINEFYETSAAKHPYTYYLEAVQKAERDVVYYEEERIKQVQKGAEDEKLKAAITKTIA